MATAEELATLLQLTPHPAGCSGWFRQTYSDPTIVATPGGDRAASTAIYFLQKFGQKSEFHRQRSAETFHHYAGAPLALYWITEAGELGSAVLGPDIAAGQLPQVRAVTWGWYYYNVLGGGAGRGVVCPAHRGGCGGLLLPHWSDRGPRVEPPGRIWISGYLDIWRLTKSPGHGLPTHSRARCHVPKTSLNHQGVWRQIKFTEQ